MEIHELIKNRWSPVVFSEKMVEDEKLKVLFEAARWAPSSSNQQPWRFMVAKKTDRNFNLFYDCVNKNNKRWVKNVPVLALSVAQVISDYTNAENKYAFHDTGMAVGNLLLQATSVGLYVHQMGGYDKKMARINLNIPAEYEPVAMIAIGYLGESNELQERDKNLRKRKQINEFVFTHEWNKNFFKS